MDINDLRSFLTVLMFVLFIGIVWWTYSAKHKQGFDEAARLALDDEPDMPADRAGQQHN